MKNDNISKEKYIGSVRFYKHLILAVVATLILVPTCLSIVLAVWNVNLNKQIHKASVRLVELEEELAKKNEDINVAEVRKTDNLASTGKKVFVGKQVNKDDWNMILVNEDHPIPEKFEVELVKLAGGQKVDARILEPLDQMFAAMRKAGLSPMVCSGYRTIEKQFHLFEEDIRTQVRKGSSYEQAFFKAKEETALPGASEHHTGLAVDIVGKSHQSLDQAQRNTKEAKWLLEHCAEYGFILRYPQNKTDITGIAYESWHFRYVGEEAAQYIMSEGLAFEEFIEML